MISLYDKPTDQYTWNVANTPVVNNRYFELTIDVPNDSTLENVQLMPITGVLNEVPSIAHDMTWEIAGISKLDDLVKTISDNSMVKTFSQLSNNYMTAASTDGWTQKFPKASSTLKLDLSFRAYAENIYNTTNYTDIIHSLTFGVTPVKHEISDSVLNVASGLDFAKKSGDELVRLIQNAPDKNRFVKKTKTNNEMLNIPGIDIEQAEEDNTGFEKIKEDLESAVEKFDKLMQNFLASNSTGGCARYNIKIEKLIDSTQSYDIYFYISNWSFKPSMETIWFNNMHCPAYIDFNLGLETDRMVNADILSSILIK